MQDSEAMGEQQSFAEYKRQRRAEQDDVEFPDEVSRPAFCNDATVCQSGLSSKCRMHAWSAALFSFSMLSAADQLVFCHSVLGIA